MAWLDKDPSGFFHVCFRLGERKLKRSLRTKNDRQANAACLRLEENLRLVELGCLELPSGGDIPVFLLTDGRLNGKPEARQRVKPSCLAPGTRYRPARRSFQVAV
jgi:hypothetical protein